MRKLAVPFAMMVVALVGFFLWMNRLPPFDVHPEPVDTALVDLRVDQEAVRITGTAHYPLLVSYVVPAAWGRPAQKRWLFPMFGHQDTMGRTIVAMVSSPLEPERLVTYEDMTVEGEARTPRIAVTLGVEHAFRDAGYQFQEDYVLVVVYQEDADPS
jgi:hypothetical protein